MSKNVQTYKNCHCKMNEGHTSIPLVDFV